MKKLYCLLLFFIGLFTSCEQEYEIDKKLSGQYKPQVVLNSIITPESQVLVKMFWSKKYNDQWSYSPVDLFDIRLYEDDVLVESGNKREGSITFDFRPTEGRSYRVEADIPDYGTVKAETSIPKAAKGKVVFSKWKDLYAHWELTQIDVPESKRAVWLRPSTRKGDRYGDYFEELFSLSPFPDQINASLETEFITETESNIVYEYFIRIPRKNIEACVPLRFSFMCYSGSFPRDPDEWEEDWEYDYYPGENEREEILINLITPSDEYDKYYRSIYKQELYNYEADFPIFGESVQVFSNIENGLGIFAGYAVNTQVFDANGGEL